MKKLHNYSNSGRTPSGVIRFVNTIRLFAVMGVSALMFACSGNVAPGNISIDMRAAVNDLQSVKLSNYASSIEYIPLELKDSSYLFEGMGLVETENSYIFHTSNKSVNVAFYEYDKSGNYIRSVGSKGRAKGEFISNQGICYNPTTKDCALLDNNKLLIYAPDGSFKAETPLLDFRTIGFPKIFSVGGNYIVNTITTGNMQSLMKGEMDDMIIVVDKEGVVLERIKLSATPVIHGTLPSGRPTVSGNGMMFYANDNIVRLHRENGVDTIKCLSPETFETMDHYILKGGEEGLLMHKFSYMENSDLIFMDVLKKTSHFPNVDKNSPRVVPLLYDKKQNKTMALAVDQKYAISGFTNDIDNGAPFWPSHINGNKMFKLTDAEEFVELAALSNSARMKEVASKLNSESNPVLVVVTLK